MPLPAGGMMRHIGDIQELHCYGDNWYIAASMLCLNLAAGIQRGRQYAGVQDTSYDLPEGH